MVIVDVQNVFMVIHFPLSRLFSGVALLSNLFYVTQGRFVNMNTEIYKHMNTEIFKYEYRNI